MSQVFIVLPTLFSAIEGVFIYFVFYLGDVSSISSLSCSSYFVVLLFDFLLLPAEGGLVLPEVPGLRPL